MPRSPRPASARRSTSAAAAASLQQWMQRSPQLLGLRQQVRDSLRMAEELRQALPAELASAVLAGRCADGGWTLHASSPAVAAKLKLFVPLLLRRLQTAGWPLQRIQVRVLMARAAAAAPDAPATRPAPPEVRERLRALRRRRADG